MQLYCFLWTLAHCDICFAKDNAETCTLSETLHNVSDVWRSFYLTKARDLKLYVLILAGRQIYLKFIKFYPHLEQFKEQVSIVCWSRTSKIWRAKKTFNNRTRQKMPPVNLEVWSRWSRISLPVTIVCSLSFPPLDSLDIALIYPPPFLTQLSKCLGRRKRLKLTHSSVETIFNFLLAGWNESTRRWSPNTSPCHSQSKSKRNAVQI